MNEELTENLIAKELLKKVDLTQCDLARLVLEAIENLGNLARGLNRVELIVLLRNTLQKGVSVVKSATHTVTLEVAAWASVDARKDLRPSSKRDLRHFVRRILRVEGIAQLPLRSMTPIQCKKILETAFGSSPSSYTKGRVILHSIFTYGIRQEWCDVNPVIRIEVPKIKEM